MYDAAPEACADQPAGDPGVGADRPRKRCRRGHRRRAAWRARRQSGRCSDAASVTATPFVIRAFRLL